uniref:Ras-related and estrogen-regulated growth inhibitor n=1 Tax=Steinernema glaseri TaxID=37863 RepID=A0A1I7ZTU5_9BILA
MTSAGQEHCVHSITEEQPQEHCVHSITEEQPQFTQFRIKLAVVGDELVGKTSFIRRLVHNTFEAPSTSKPPSFRQVIFKPLEDEKTKIELLDCDYSWLSEYVEHVKLKRSAPPEQRKDGKYVEFIDTNGVFVLYDVCAPNTLRRAQEIVRDLNMLVSPDCEVFLIATKTDQRGTEMAKIDFKTGEQVAERLGYSLFETSARSGTGCNRALSEMVWKIKDRRDEVRQYVAPSDSAYKNPVDEETEEKTVASIFWTIFSCQ